MKLAVLSAYTGWCDQSRYQATSTSSLREIFDLMWSWPGNLIVLTLWALGIVATMRSVASRRQSEFAALLLGSAVILYAARLLLGRTLFCQAYEAREVFHQSLYNFGTVAAGSLLLGLPIFLAGYALTAFLGGFVPADIRKREVPEDSAMSIRFGSVAALALSALCFLFEPVLACVVCLFSGCGVAVMDSFLDKTKGDIGFTWPALLRLGLCAVVIAAASGFMISGA